MITKILGYLWIIAGVFFVLKPQILKNSIQRKSLKKLRKYFIFIAVLLGALLISVGWKLQGFLAKMIIVLGIISIFKGVFLLKAKVADKMIEWFAAKPLIFFRTGACFYILIGVIILLLR